MILVDKLDDTEFPTFPQFQQMLRAYEAGLRQPRPVAAPTLAPVLGRAIAAPLPQRFPLPVAMQATPLDAVEEAYYQLALDRVSGHGDQGVVVCHGADRLVVETMTTLDAAYRRGFRFHGQLHLQTDPTRSTV